MNKFYSLLIFILFVFFGCSENQNLPTFPNQSKNDSSKPGFLAKPSNNVCITSEIYYGAEYEHDGFHGNHGTINFGNYSFGYDFDGDYTLELHLNSNYLGSISMTYPYEYFEWVGWRDFDINSNITISVNMRVKLVVGISEGSRELDYENNREFDYENHFDFQIKIYSKVGITGPTEVPKRTNVAYTVFPEACSNLYSYDWQILYHDTYWGDAPNAANSDTYIYNSNNYPLDTKIRCIVTSNGGTQTSNIINLTVIPNLSAPSNFQASPYLHDDYNQKVTLSWNACSDPDVTGYEIFRQKYVLRNGVAVAGSFYCIKTITSRTSSCYTDSPLWGTSPRQGIGYIYRIRSLNNNYDVKSEFSVVGRCYLEKYDNILP